MGQTEEVWRFAQNSVQVSRHLSAVFPLFSSVSFAFWVVLDLLNFAATDKSNITE